jgi:hypothetical protein|tara:strand:+ start:23 stop:424 length:402 start_codon:yes stop_codon:yes gene_type:complete
MNNEEFYGVLKLVSGEELFAKVSPCEEEYRTILILESPVTFETIPMKNQAHGAVRIVPWVKMCNETSFVVNMDKVITVTEVKDKEVIKLYERYLNDINGDTKEQDFNRDLGFLPSIPEARVILEKLYKKKNNS